MVQRPPQPPHTQISRLAELGGLLPFMTQHPHSTLKVSSAVTGVLALLQDPPQGPRNVWLLRLPGPFWTAAVSHAPCMLWFL